MDAEELKEEIAHQRILQKEYRKRLRVLEQQAAGFGDLFAPEYVRIGIVDLAEKINECDKKIDSYKQGFIEPRRKEIVVNDKRMALLRKEIIKTKPGEQWSFLELNELDEKLKPYSEAIEFLQQQISEIENL